MGWASASSKNINSQIQIANAAIPQFQAGIDRTVPYKREGEGLTGRIFPLTLDTATKEIAQELLGKIQEGNTFIVSTKNFFANAKHNTEEERKILLTLADELTKGRMKRTGQRTGADIVGEAISIEWQIRQRLADQLASPINGLSISEALESAQNTYNQVANDLRRYAS